jgi:hypothetical protein
MGAAAVVEVVEEVQPECSLEQSHWLYSSLPAHPTQCQIAATATHARKKEEHDQVIKNRDERNPYRGTTHANFRIEIFPQTDSSVVLYRNVIQQHWSFKPT